ncbi:MAG: hypothetical protein ACRYFU_02610 [Janthinobacterium lividum]
MNAAFAHFDWDAIYLTCFGVGLLLSLLAFAGGFLHLHLGHFKLGGQGHALGNGQATHVTQHASPINGFTIVAFLCWFGGTGYLLSHGHIFSALMVLGFSALSGAAGAGLVFWFLVKILLPREHPLEPADTPIIGVLGRVSATVSSGGGVGEMLYSQNGSRRSMPIAADDGAPISRDAEVVVLRYARGIAYVRRWDEMQQSLMGDEPAAHNSDLNTE